MPMIVELQLNQISLINLDNTIIVFEFYFLIIYIYTMHVSVFIPCMVWAQYNAHSVLIELWCTITCFNNGGQKTC